MRILTDYPYSKSGEKEKMWNDYDNFKARHIHFNRYLMNVKGHYQDLLVNEQFSDVDIIKREIYNSILIFLNRF